VDAAAKKCREATFEGAAGVVSRDEMFRSSFRTTFRTIDHPVCAFKRGFAKFS